MYVFWTIVTLVPGALLVMYALLGLFIRLCVGDFPGPGLGSPNFNWSRVAGSFALGAVLVALGVMTLVAASGHVPMR